MALNTVMHVSIRLEVPGHSANQVDVAVPAHSSFAEILGEVLTLLHAPSIAVPWQVTTPAGTPLSDTAPLTALPLTHGDIVIVRPFAETPPPMLIDVAESLVEVSQPHRPNHLSVISTTCSLCALLWCCWILPQAWLGFLTLTIGCFVTATVAQKHAPTAVLLFVGIVPIPAGCTAWSYIVTDLSQRGTVLTGGLITAATLLLASIAAYSLTACSLPLTACWATVAVLSACCMGIFALVPHELLVAGPAAAAVGFSILLLTAIPPIAIQLAGVKIPRLPSAGQDLAIADTTAHREDVEAAATQAMQIHDGLVLGVSLVGAIGIWLVCLWHPASITPYVAALCALTAIAVGLHAIRHRSIWAQRALWVWAVSCVVASVATLPIVAACMLVPGATSMLWSAKAPEWQPTTIHWLERFEAFAIAVALPLAAHIAGLFVAIRGLG